MSPTDTKAPKSQRRLVIASVVMLITAVGIGGRFYYLQRQAASGHYPVQGRIPLVTSGVAGRQREQRLAKAQWLRDKWRPWALQNKEVLRQMIQAQPNGEAAMMAAWKALPSRLHVDTVGFTFSDLSTGVEATWQPATRDDKAPPGEVKWAQMIEDTNRQQMKRLRRDYAARHDILLSYLSHPDSPNTFFWASGRITQQDSKPLQVKTMAGSTTGEVVWTEQPHQELWPAYEFLK